MNTSGNQPGGLVNVRLFNISILLLAGGLLCFVAISAAVAQTANEIEARTEREIAALVKEKAARTPTQAKIDSQLIYAEKQRRFGFVLKETPDLKPAVRLEGNDRVKVDITAKVSDELLQEIAAAGGSVLSSFPQDHAIRANLPLAKVESIAVRKDVKFIQPAVEAVYNTGSVNSRGDIAHASNVARAFPTPSLADGSGIKVGVLSDSIDNGSGAKANSIQRGDIPSNLTVLSGQAGSGNAEGLAMCEIVHDLAPAAQLYFATAIGGEAAMANNIRALANAGCKVIIDDVLYFDESPFQDGVIAKAVNQVSAQGVLYFSAAGNMGRTSTYEGYFVNGGAARGGVAHSFGGAKTNQISVGTATGRVDLFWNDALGHSGNDYDLYVIGSGGGVLGSSTNIQNGTQNPYETATGYFSGGNGADGSTSDRIQVIKSNAAQARFLHLDACGGVVGCAGLEVHTGGSVRGHNASGAPNAFCVAATSAQNQTTRFTSANPVESFSSNGPRRIYYDSNGNLINNLTATGGLVLNKPDVTAADGVSTTVPGFSPFFGTSAAAPHAGAIAAQVLSHLPGATPLTVRAALQKSGTNATAFNFSSGYGIILTDTAAKYVPTRVMLADFNGDNKPDYVLFNAITDQVAVWYMNGSGGITSTQFAVRPPADWTLVAVGDFDNDGHPDYFLYNARTRQIAIWFLNGPNFSSSVYGPDIPPGWILVAVADFNGDGRPEYVLTAPATGKTAIWYLNANGSFNSSAYGPTLPVGWTLVGSTDYDADNNADFILTNISNGQTAIWYLSGAAFDHSRYGQDIPPGYILENTADINADGKPDFLLFRLSDRLTYNYYLNSSALLSGSAPGPVIVDNYGPDSP